MLKERMVISGLMPPFRGRGAEEPGPIRAAAIGIAHGIRDNNMRGRGLSSGRTGAGQHSPGSHA